MSNLQWTWTTLLAALQTWPTDDDPLYLADIPNIIGLGELRLVRDLNLELFDRTDSSITTTTGVRTIDKPDDCIVMREAALTIDGAYTPLEKRSKTFCQMYSPDPSDQGIPIYWYEHSESLIGLVPTPNGVYVANQYIVSRPLDGLDSTTPTDTSWLSRTVPDALFAACLMEAEGFLKADDRYGDYKSKYYQELLPVARLELRNSIRTGDRNPITAAPVTQ